MAREYKFIRLEGTREALVVVFLNPNIFAADVIQGIGRELLFAADTAARIDMPLWLSFRDVEDMSSAMIGKLVLLHRKAKTVGVKLQFREMSPVIASVIRKFDV